jgi:hypothetical protein
LTAIIDVTLVLFCKRHYFFLAPEALLNVLFKWSVSGFDADNSASEFPEKVSSITINTLLLLRLQRWHIL